MSTVQPSRKIFQKAAMQAENAQKVECKPLDLTSTSKIKEVWLPWLELKTERVE